MTTYIVWHENRRKKIEIEIHPNDEWKISRGISGFLYGILKTYKRKAGYSSYMDYRGLKFERKNTPEPSFFSQPAFAEPCDKDWCNACREGRYEKCPNKH